MMNNHHHYALSHYLREYNYEDAFTDVLTAIQLGLPTITPHDDYSAWGETHLIMRIKEMAINLAKAYSDSRDSSEDTYV